MNHEKPRGRIMKISLANTDRMTKWMTAVVFNIAAFSVSAASAQVTDDCADSLQCESSWLGLSDSERDTVFAFAEDYKAFIHLARTELSFVSEAVAFAEANG